MPITRLARPALRPLKGVVQGGFEFLWSRGFAALGRLCPPKAELWSSDGARKVLVVATHPDDEVAGCAGTILRHRRCGDRVVVAFVTDGRGSRAYGMSPDEMAGTRRLEAREAIRILGVEEEWLGLPENAWRPEQLRTSLRGVLERHSPDLVYAPSRIDFHPEHERVARVLATALTGELVRVFAVQVPLTPSLCNLIAPIRGEAEVATEALRAYDSQLGTLLRCLRHRRYLGRLYGRRGPVEEFWQMSAEQYRRLHGERPPRPLTRTFRGIRYYAWTDPLAYLRSQRERRRLAGGLGKSVMSAERPERQWCLRAFRPGDEVPVTELFQRVIERRIDVAQWRWKFQQRPSSVENVWLAVDADDRPIFHYGGIPCRLELPEGRRTAMISVDALTDPDFQRRGVLGTCGAEIFKRWREAGIDLTLGLPNERWGSRARALGWQPLFPLRWQVRPLRPERTLARKLAIPALSRWTALSYCWNLFWDRPGRSEPGLGIEDVEQAGDEFDTLSEACRREGLVSIVRGREWVQWRYLAHPSHRYRVIAARRQDRLTAYLVYRTEDTAAQKLGYVAELVSIRSDRAAQRALLGTAVRRFRDQGAVAAFALAVPKTDLDRALRRAGFLFTRGSFSVQCVPFAADLDLEVLRDPRRWRMNGGDFDVI